MLIQRYMGAPLALAVTMYASNPNDLLTALAAVRLISLIVFIVLTMFLLVVFYAPLVEILDTERRRTCLMLLMIPPVCILRKRVKNEKVIVRLHTQLLSVVENFVCTGVIVKYEKCTRNRFKDRDYGWSRLDVADKGR